jgi:hypothetical protein
VTEIKNNDLKVKVEYNTRDYLSCEILFDTQKTHFVKKLKKSFGDLVKNLPVYKTPGTPNNGIVRPAVGESRLDENKQKIYQSAVGTLLQFTKHLRLDIANPVRELSKCMDSINEAAFKEMKRVIKFILDT